jgi:hypothetical protein
MNKIRKFAGEVRQLIHDIASWVAVAPILGISDDLHVIFIRMIS